MTLILLAIGLCAGVLSGLFGIGGGIVIVPALMLWGRMEPAKATGTSLAALLLPVGVFGAMEYHRNGHIDIRAALLISAGLAVGAYFGALIAQPLSPLLAKRIFGVFLLLVAAKFLFGK